MNANRIQELAEQAGYNPRWSTKADKEEHFDKEKFAELIIAECAKLCEPAAQPEQEWVGLTLTDREQLRDEFEDWNYPAILIDAIADKLKEKNHD